MSLPGGRCRGGGGRTACTGRESKRMKNRARKPDARNDHVDLLPHVQEIAGMTGTAETEAAEFDKIYKLEVVVIPTNKTLIRIEIPTWCIATGAEKFEAVVNGILQEDNTLAGGIRQFYRRGQPVLVGTISIEKSETIADLLKKSAIRTRC